MAKSIESILAMKELLGIIHDVADGLPEAILPAGMLTPTRTITGNTGSVPPE